MAWFSRAAVVLLSSVLVASAGEALPRKKPGKKPPEPTSQLRLTPRLDRFFPLSEAVGYSGSGSYDMIIWIPRGRPGFPAGQLRLWLKTEAKQPEIEISTARHRPVGPSARDPGWLDFGLIDRGSEEFGIAGFACMRVRGLTAMEARQSCVIITPQIEVQPAGSLREVEKALCGIARDEAGRTTISPSRAGLKTPTEFTLSYEAGPRGLPPGSLLRMAFPKAFSTPQQTSRDAPGWIEFCQAEPPVEIASIAGSIESHERIDAIFRLPGGIPPGGRIAIRYRTDFTYLFPHRWAEVDRRYWWSELPPMATAVAVDPRQVFVPPLAENSHAVDFLAGLPERLHLFLPGRVPQGGGYRLGGIFTDRYRNVPSPGPIDGELRLRLRGEKIWELGSPAGHFARWYRFSVPLPPLPPGVYRAEAYDPRTGQLRAESNPVEILAAGDPRPPIYWGQIHAHSEQSDGTGRFEEIYLFCRDEACLDFAAGSDHAEYFSDNEWQWMQDVSNGFNGEGRFVTLLGYEWAGRQGHRNVYSSADRLDLFRGMDTATCQLHTVYDHFAGREDVVAGPHVGHTGDFFAEHNPSVQRFHELYSMWGHFDKLTFEILNKGAVIGVTGGGDCHEGRGGFSSEDPEGQGTTPHTFAPGLKWKTGLTAALMPRLGRKALLHALRERQIYATTGARILVDFAVSGIRMGERGKPGAEAPTVTAAIHAAGPIDRVEIIRDGALVHSVAGAGRDQTVSWPDATAGSTAHWYMLRAVQQDQETVWTSPVWVDR